MANILKWIFSSIHQGAVLSLTGVRCPASELWDRWARRRWWSTTTLRLSALTLTSVTAFTLRSWPWSASWTSPNRRSGCTQKHAISYIWQNGDKTYRYLTVYTSYFYHWRYFLIVRKLNYFTQKRHNCNHCCTTDQWSVFHTHPTVRVAGHSGEVANL